MTREEAIKSLQFVRNALDNSMDIAKAYEIAIKALEQQPCDDAISRQAAIDAMREETCGCCWDARDILAHLPTVRTGNPNS